MMTISFANDYTPMCFFFNYRPTVHGCCQPTHISRTTRRTAQFTRSHLWRRISVTLTPTTWKSTAAHQSTRAASWGAGSGRPATSTQLFNQVSALQCTKLCSLYLYTILNERFGLNLSRRWYKLSLKSNLDPLINWALDKGRNSMYRTNICRCLLDNWYSYNTLVCSYNLFGRKVRHPKFFLEPKNSQRFTESIAHQTEFYYTQSNWHWK
jgi:hypothetical protein